MNKMTDDQRRERDRNRKREKRQNDQEYREKMNENKRDKYQNDQEFREKVKEISRERYQKDEEYREKEKENKRDKYQNDQGFKEKIKEISRERYQNDEEYREKMNENKRDKYQNDEEFREKVKEKERERYQNDEEYREKVKERERHKYQNDEEFREKVKESKIERYQNDEEYREKVKERERERYQSFVYYMRKRKFSFVPIEEIKNQTLSALEQERFEEAKLVMSKKRKSYSSVYIVLLVPNIHPRTQILINCPQRVRDYLQEMTGVPGISFFYYVGIGSGRRLYIVFSNGRHWLVPNHSSLAQIVHWYNHTAWLIRTITFEVIRPSTQQYHLGQQCESWLQAFGETNLSRSDLNINSIWHPLNKHCENAKYLSMNQEDQKSSWKHGILGKNLVCTISGCTDPHSPDDISKIGPPWSTCWHPNELIIRKFRTGPCTVTNYKLSKEFLILNNIPRILVNEIPLPTDELKGTLFIPPPHTAPDDYDYSLDEPYNDEEEDIDDSINSCSGSGSDDDEALEEEEEEVKPKFKSKIYKRKKAVISEDDDDDDKVKVVRKSNGREKKKLPTKNGKPKTIGKKLGSSKEEVEEEMEVSNQKESTTPAKSSPEVKNKSAITVVDVDDEVVEEKADKEKKDDKPAAGDKKAKKKTAEAKTPKTPKQKAVKPSASKSSTKKPAQKRGSKNDDNTDDKSTKPDTLPSDKDDEKDQPEKKRTKSDEKAVAETKKKSPVLLKTPMPLLSTPTTTMSIAASAKGGKTEYLVTKSSNEYDPIEHAIWKKGQNVPYIALAKTLEAIEETSSRLRIIEILSNFFRSVILLSPDELLFCLYLCLNQLAPAYEGIELGIAETNIMQAIEQAIEQATGRSMDSIKTAMGEKVGDLGLVAEASRSNVKKSKTVLFVEYVYQVFKDIYKIYCSASERYGDEKIMSRISSLLIESKPCEARYIVRSLAGKLRIGLAEQSVLQALATANYLTPMNQDMEKKWPPKVLNAGKGVSKDTLKKKIDDEALVLKSAYCECPNYDILIKALIETGIKGLSKKCKLTPGIPPKPMLAQPTKGVQEVLRRFENMKFTCEYKYDGERAQIHLLEDGSIRIYSRNQENNTSKYPDIISRFKNTIQGDVKSCIIDSEAVAWDSEKKMILPFQVLSTRKRKDANESEIKVHVVLYAFDLIYLNGESLVRKTFLDRRQLLKDNFKEIEGEMMFAKNLDTDSMEDVQEFLEESIKGNCEGLMLKTLDVDASYELSKRSHKWLKLKKDYLDSGGDSLDLVVIGGFFGRGERTGTYGGFLLACYEPDNEEFQTICKIGTGFSDEQLAQHTESLKPHIIKNPKPYYRSHSNLTPDHWFDAVQVWEVKCADLSLSPVHTAGAGIVDPIKGISLRFPRFLRIRDDKNAEDATSASQVAQMYKGQEQVKNVNASKTESGDEDEDFY